MRVHHGGARSSCSTALAGTSRPRRARARPAVRARAPPRGSSTSSAARSATRSVGHPRTGARPLPLSKSERAAMRAGPSTSRAPRRVRACARAPPTRCLQAGAARGRFRKNPSGRSFLGGYTAPRVKHYREAPQHGRPAQPAMYASSARDALRERYDASANSSSEPNGLEPEQRERAATSSLAPSGTRFSRLGTLLHHVSSVRRISP